MESGRGRRRRRQELIYRRIGRNELGAIGVCKGIVDAENDYLAANPEKATVKTYAAKLMSDPGRHNGLYWEAQPGEPESPAGPLIAKAGKQGYSDASEPYHGYYFRMLTEQGKSAPGGAKPFVVGGAATGGFAVVAWPANYRSSGVMTFIVGPDGVVYQKDLGDDTEKLAEAMTSYDPDSSWTRAEGEQAGCSSFSDRRSAPRRRSADCPEADGRHPRPHPRLLRRSAVRRAWSGTGHPPGG